MSEKSAGPYTTQTSSAENRLTGVGVAVAEQCHLVGGRRDYLDENGVRRVVARLRARREVPAPVGAGVEEVGGAREAALNGPWMSPFPHLNGFRELT
jgi:hypothetical protein